MRWFAPFALMALALAAPASGDLAPEPGPGRPVCGPAQRVTNVRLIHSSPRKRIVVDGIVLAGDRFGADLGFRGVSGKGTSMATAHYAFTACRPANARTRPQPARAEVDWRMPPDTGPVHRIVVSAAGNSVTLRLRAPISE